MRLALYLGLCLGLLLAVAPLARAWAAKAQPYETITAASPETPPADQGPDEGAGEDPPPEADAAKAAEASAPPPEAAAPAAPEQKAAPGNAPAPVRLFGTVEFRSVIKNLPKWERVMNSEIKRPSFMPSGLDAANPQVKERWAKQKEKIAGESLKEQAQRVNNFFNQWPYKTDLNVWGLEDYWATPREFVNKSGDCEDYAIAKYYALRDLGVPAGKLRVAAIRDTIRNLGHAVLIVYMENDAYVLDNLTNLVLSHKKLTHYAPQYSVNEEFLWRHVKPKPAPKK